MHTWKTLNLLTIALAASCGLAVAKSSGPISKQEIQGAVEKWVTGVTGPGKSYKATFRASDGVSPLPSKRVNNRLFAFEDGDLYIGIGFSKPPRVDSSLKDLRATFAHIALDRVQVPGVQAKGWETRLLTPLSSFKKGVTIKSWKDGVLCVQVQTEFFAATGRRMDILVPADAGLPEGTYFQVRKPIKADLVIEGRLFPAK